MTSQTFDFNSGPEITGSWKNYRTGEVINIRDTIIEDNQLIGISDRGMQIPFSKLSSFVKLDSREPSRGPDYSNVSKPATKKVQPKPFVDDVDKEYNANYADAMSEYEDEANRLLNTPIRPAVQPVQQPTINPAITKVLEGLAEKDRPKINIDIEWKEVPEGIMFLKKYLDISEGDIVKACIDKYIDLDQIRLKLSIQLSTIIENALGGGNKADLPKIHVEDKPESVSDTNIPEEAQSSETEPVEGAAPKKTSKRVVRRKG